MPEGVRLTGCSRADPVRAGFPASVQAGVRAGIGGVAAAEGSRILCDARPQTSGRATARQVDRAWNPQTPTTEGCFGTVANDVVQGPGEA